MRTNFVSFPLAQLEVQEHDLEPLNDSNHPAELDEDLGSGPDHVIFDPAIFEKLLQQECKLWQKKLRLQDWNIHVSVCRLNEMPDQDCIGFIKPEIERKDAKMLILSPMDSPLVSDNFINHEEINYALTIVHELLHLHLFPFTQRLNEQETVAEEQAVNALSRCIVAAYAAKIKPLTVPTSLLAPGNYL
jgi:hypothetical protein